MPRESIIKQTREALRQKNEIATAAAYAEERERQQRLAGMQDVAVDFARQWLSGGGTIDYCTNEEELSQALQDRQPVMLCEALLADTGSILLSDREGNRVDLAHLPEQMNLAAFSSQAAPDWEEALARMTDRPRNLLPLAPQKNTHLILIEDL